MFKDRTYLVFDVEPFLRITPDYSDWKTHNYKPLKRWPPLRSDRNFFNVNRNPLKQTVTKLLGINRSDEEMPLVKARAFSWVS